MNIPSNLQLLSQRKRRHYFILRTICALVIILTGLTSPVTCFSNHPFSTYWRTTNSAATTPTTTTSGHYNDASNQRHVQGVITSITTRTTSSSSRRYAAASVSTTPETTNKNNKNDKNMMKDSYDVVIVGSGIGGLSCAAMLCLYGYSVAVFESHYAAGGAAHGFRILDNNIPSKLVEEEDATGGGGPPVPGTFIFDTGPSFFSGLNSNLPAKASNPLRTILDAIDESVDCIPYTSFGLKFPEGDFLHTPDFGRPDGVLDQIQEGSSIQWQRLMNNMKPLAQAVDALPTAALRSDLGVILSALPFLSNFATLNPLENLKLTKPYQSIIDASGITHPMTQNWLDLLCFCLSGLPAKGTITAEMAMMMGEFYEPDAVMDCPKGGARAIVDALVRGIEKHGGSIFLNSPVEEIMIDHNNSNKKQATGIRLKRSNRIIYAKDAVVSNLSVWDLMKSGIIDTSIFPPTFVKERTETPVGKSFMHLHVGFQVTQDELDQLQAHYMYIKDWSRGVEAEDNAVLVSIPSVHDPTLAPSGYAVLHAYTPATEDFSRWEHIDSKSPEYQTLKEERSQYLWTVLETIIPDIRNRTHISRVGTPLTHQRFLRRYKGSYGPAIIAGEGSFPFPKTPIDGLLVCGDSVFPGIGVPAVAGSGLLAANSVSFSSLQPQLELLKSLKK